jgi:hypothetical protein
MKVLALVDDEDLGVISSPGKRSHCKGQVHGRVVVSRMLEEGCMAD